MRIGDRTAHCRLTRFQIVNKNGSCFSVCTFVDDLLLSLAWYTMIAAPQADIGPFEFEGVIDAICGMAWNRLNNDEVLQVAKIYYYFSVQFRENLEIACRLRPRDTNLAALRRDECATDNLSPWPAVAAEGEKMDHDEFMRRLLRLQPVCDEDYLTALGANYLSRARAVDDRARAHSIASYEDGGLSRVFMAMLRMPHWYGQGQRAFRYFLKQHIQFDTGNGHGALTRCLEADDSILPVWSAFHDLLRAGVPRLAAGGGVADPTGAHHGEA